MARIPGRKRRRFWEHKAVVEALAVIPPIVAAAVTAILNLRDSAKRSLGWVLIGASVWLAVASVIKVLNAQAQDAAQKKSEGYDGLLAALHVLHGAVRSRSGIESLHDGRLRTTIHRVATVYGEAEEVEQLLPYIGGTGSPPGRTFSVRSGIVGKAVRERSVFAASRVSSDYEAFLTELVRDWSYTIEDARKLSPDRRAWMAVPIPVEGGPVVAAVYLDSSEPDFSAWKSSGWFWMRVPGLPPTSKRCTEMNEIGRLKRRGSPAFKSTVVSQKGAAIRVERIELSDRMKQNLTTPVKKLGVPKSGRNS